MAMKPVYNESTYSNTFYSVTQLSSSFFPRLIEPFSAAAIKQQADSNRRCGTSQYVSSQRVMQARMGSQDFRYEHSTARPLMDLSHAWSLSLTERLERVTTKQTRGNLFLTITTRFPSCDSWLID